MKRYDKKPVSHWCTVKMKQLILVLLRLTTYKQDENSSDLSLLPSTTKVKDRAEMKLYSGKHVSVLQAMKL